MKKTDIVLLICLAAAAAVPARAQAPNPLIRLEEEFEFEKLERYLEMVERHGSDQVPARYLKALLEEDGPRALAIYQEVASRDSLGIYADRALWRIAQYYYIRGDYPNAHAALSDLVRRYPRSDLLAKAEDQMGRISQMGVTPPVRTAPSVGGASAAVAPPVQAPAPQSRGNFTIQAGAFSSAGNADFLKNYLVEQGFGDTYVSRRQVGDKTLYMVWVGSYVAREDAERQKNLLSAKISNIRFFIKALP